MRFSERIGKRRINKSIQIDNMDNDLRNGLWNILYMIFINPMCESNEVRNSVFQNLVHNIWFSFLKEPVDQMPSSTKSVAAHIKALFYHWDYLEAYDFLDFVANNSELHKFQKIFCDNCNFILKRELAGYRFINHILAPITNDQELLSIEDAITTSDNANYRGVSIHIKAALSKLADKKSPDYRNSIKESISAVESICKIISGDKSAVLGTALKKLKTKNITIHQALEQSFTKLYGYTSDAEGIRHAMLEEDGLDQEDALYMLISCSAFINYLIAKTNKTDIDVQSV